MSKRSKTGSGPVRPAPKLSSPSTTVGNDKPLWKLLTIEPVFVIHTTTAMMAFMAVQDLLLVKACRINFNYGDKVCSALESGDKESFAEQDQHLQKLISSVMMWRTMMENLFPILLVCLIGAWSDKYGRKLPMLFVLMSFVIQHICLVMSALDKQYTGAWSVGWISSVIVSLAGNNACFGMAVFCYAGDTTPKEKLTTRTAITGSCIVLGLTLGLALNGILAASSWSHYQIFGVAAILESIGFLYVLFFIKNVRDEKAIKGISTKQMIMDLFNMQNIYDAVNSVVKKRPGNDRVKLHLLLMCHALVMAPMFGESTVTFLFGRYQFNWDASSLAAFMTYRTVLGFVGNLVSMILLTEGLKLSDPAIGIVSCGSALASLFIFAFAKSTTMMYVGPIVALLSGSIMTVARSILFKFVPGTETGKVNAFIGSLESLTPLVVTPLYTTLYTSTFEQLPGAFFLLSAFCMVPPILVYIWLLSEHKKSKTK